MNETFWKYIKKRILKILFVVIVILFIVPLFFNLVLPIKTGITVMSLDAWLSFWGSFIGGIFTIIALWFTIEYTSYENEKTRKQALIDSENTRRINQKENEKLRENQLDVLKIELEIDKLDRDYLRIKEFTHNAFKILNMAGINNLAQYPNSTFEQSFTYDLQLFELDAKLIYDEMKSGEKDNEYFDFINTQIELLAESLAKNIGFDISNQQQLTVIKEQIESGNFSCFKEILVENKAEDIPINLKIKRDLFTTKSKYVLEFGNLTRSYLTYKHEQYTAKRENLTGEKIATIEGDKKVPTLEWIGKNKVINHHNEVPYKVLDEVYTYGAESSENKIIRGDNLEALKALLPQYEGKIKCIYIDPPYNTGNEKWVYNDNVNDPKIKKWLGDTVGKEGEDLSRHDKWLCMMYPRLKLLQRLLADDGAIFISIDDNEQANLKLICDEIFGQRNYVKNIAIINNLKGRSDDKFIATAHESLLIYQKGNFTSKGVDLPEEYQNEYKLSDSKGKYRLQGLRKRGAGAKRQDRPNMFYSFYYNDNTKKLSLDSSDTAIEIAPKLSDGSDGRWRWGKDTAASRIDELTVSLVKGRNEYDVFQKDYLPSDGKRIKPKSFWMGSEFSAESGTLQTKSILGKDVFNTPKPTSLIEYCLEQAIDEDSIVLDSFAGSGTTAHAVLNMNNADGGNRKFILVEMEDYAETITAERVRRVIDGYGEGKNAVDGTGGSFTFYDLGEPLLIDNQYLNENVSVQKLREYIFFMETKQVMEISDYSEKYLLGTHQNGCYYFVYERDSVTTLDYSFLEKIKTQSEEYVIYADINALSNEELKKHHIIFKKIPRDIAKL